MDPQKSDSIQKQYWEDRAKEYGTNQRATLSEVRLRELEVRTMLRWLKELRPATVLDVGCGNGYSTARFARALPDAQFIGVDYSEEMIRLACLAPAPNVRYQVADLTIPQTVPSGPFDVILTQRCIQNLLDYAKQRAAVEVLLSRKSPRGALLLMECSKDGVEQLQALRKRVGKAPIEGIEPWHNLFLRDRAMVESFGARIMHFSSTYMYLTKVFTFFRPRRLAGYLPAVGRFGYDKLYVIR